MRSRFITVEGLDGAGKTTHLAWIERRLTEWNIPVVVTREPGGTPLGEELRKLLLGGTHKLRPETETLLMFAARCEHIATVIQPALDGGKWVLCDRFTDATFAYQAAGSGVEWSRIETLEHWVQGTLQPDLTLYFDVETEVAKARGQAVKAPDRFEQEHAPFHDRVRKGYLRRARDHGNRIRVIDSNPPLPLIQAELEAILVAFRSESELA